MPLAAQPGARAVRQSRGGPEPPGGAGSRGHGARGAVEPGRAVAAAESVGGPLLVRVGTGRARVFVDSVGAVVAAGAGGREGRAGKAVGSRLRDVVSCRVI